MGTGIRAEADNATFALLTHRMPLPPRSPAPLDAPAPQVTTPGVAAATPKRGYTSKIDPFADLVGVLPDRTIAQRAGTTIGSVQAWRSRRGIPAPVGAPLAPLAPVDEEYAASRSDSELADIELPADPDLPALTAYRFRAARGAEVREFFIVADDIGDAGVRAIAALSRAGGRPWRVVAVSELGEALE